LLFGHAQIALTLVVREGDGVVGKEAEYMIAVVLEALDNIVNRQFGCPAE
jgi:hypothetical protein